ncbi:hypothetical protein ATANTOWER_007926 [Ataeniobius toweri]|uniref:Secreted protein n=1 Tax=Ataeniobius toweri TaxID=208326 RepID=A0ABU7A2B9_9TELE|nr:hypothetical protein [Ataeniobius toweri]
MHAMLFSLSVFKLLSSHYSLLDSSVASVLNQVPCLSASPCPVQFLSCMSVLYRQDHFLQSMRLDRDGRRAVKDGTRDG